MANSKASDLKERIAAARGKSMNRRGAGFITGAGVFLVKLKSTKRFMAFDAGFKKRDREFFIAEFEILESNNEQHPKGSSASWMCKDPSEDNIGDVKAFCIAVQGFEPRAVKDDDEETQDQAALLAFAAMGESEAFEELGIEDPNYFVGKLVRLETSMIKTKAGKDFTRHAWSPAEETEADEAEGDVAA